ncbi:unnamed protein product [Zymoseptoria tritici ST99CH_1E4]|uniref:Uncharacterized protein n=1 Tax=Zymoseptoria tritici ST99CH_1E4 TaxID=1276532 RepID=A0A2H1H9X2_ZYMTR|nr:unnamed protein product [Zymoseptoria tritici ST99CH_1E4]
MSSEDDLRSFIRTWDDGNGSATDDDDDFERSTNRHRLRSTANLTKDDIQELGLPDDHNDGSSAIKSKDESPKDKSRKYGNSAVNNQSMD